MVEPSSPQGFPLVSIGVAVFNGGEPLSLALQSLASQDYPRIEIIICDDGSTDGSVERCEAFAALHPYCRVVRNPMRLGMAGNYNQLIALARGKYLVLADQDDRRESTFVSRCVEILERDPEAVLCHSHTGVVWPTMESALYHVISLDSIDGVRPVVRRYWRFLRHYSDTTIYGLIRLNAMRRTRRWQEGLGSANRLLFELLLMGTFRQVPETLYWYTAKGLRSRPGPAEEYERLLGGRQMPRYYLPFLALAWSQTKGIANSDRTMIEKSRLFAVLWTHVVLVNATKLLYRFLWRVSGKRLPARFERRCAELVYSTSDLRFVVRPADDREYYPEGWPLRGP